MRISSLARAGLLSAVLASVLVACGADVPTEEEGEELGSTESHLANANDRTAFLFFVQKGLTKTQAAGVVGNLDQESSMNPKAKQKGGPGRGIAQWSQGQRWVTENSFAKSKGKDPWALDVQLEFIWHELTTVSSYGLTKLRAAKTLSSAVAVFQDKYEICGKCATGNRVKFAQAALDAFGSAAVEPANDDKGADDEGADDANKDEVKPAEDEPQGDCMVDGVFGDCISTSACRGKGGTSTRNLCPGPNDIQCCTK